MKKEKILVYSILLCCMVLCCVSCNKEDDVMSDMQNISNITYLPSINGLGDNGYNDNAISGIFSFSDKNHIKIQLLQPSNKEEAEQLYQEWLNNNAHKDSSLIILGSSDYEEMVCKHPTNITGKGTKVLLFESRNPNTPEGVHTLFINRYGCSYLAGAISADRDAKILAATDKDPVIKSAINGFCDGFNAHNQDQHTILLKYLVHGEDGFIMPEAVYQEMKNMYDANDFSSDIIFPLLGFSGTSIIRYANENTFFTPWIIGMDINQKGLSINIPFSMVVRIGDILEKTLEDWRNGKEWSKTILKGLKDNAIDLEFTPNFYENVNIIAGVLIDYEELYHTYYNEALEKDEYEEEQYND